MIDFLDEVEEELKQEKLQKFIHIFLPYFFIAAFLIVLIAGGYVWYIHKKNSNLENMSIEFEKISSLQSSGDINAAMRQAEIVYNMSDYNISAIAGLKLAEMILKKDNIDNSSAMEIFEEINNKAKFDITYRDLASILLISYSYTKDKHEEFIKRLDKLINNNSPWKYNALKLKLSYLVDNNNISGAKKIYNDLSKDKKIPQIFIKNLQIISELN